MPEPTRPTGIHPHHTISPKKILNQIEKQLENDYKKRLKLTTLPDDIKKGISSAAKIAAQRATRSNLELEALKIAKNFYQPTSVSNLIAGKLEQAKAGVKVVSQSVDLDEILKENAKMLRKKYEALIDPEAGAFTKEQAFQLILAEVQGKAARRGNV